MFKVLALTCTSSAMDTLFEKADADNKRTNPVVINTWVPNGFSDAARHAWTVLSNDGSALDAIEVGVSSCEQLQPFSNYT